MLRRTRLWVTVLTGATGYLACGGDTTEPPPPPPAASQMSAASGNNQTGTVGEPLADPLVVQVNDQQGSSFAGATVNFTVNQGGGSLSSSSGTTGANGQVSTTWTLGTTAGTAQQVQATVSGTNLTTTFSATATPDVPFVISKVSGDQQFAFRGTKVPAPIAVRVRDQYANGVPNQVVTFAVPSGSGAVDSAVAFTNATGEAQTGWTLGSDAGQDTAQAVIAGLTGSPVTFTATAHNLQVSSVSPSPLVEGQAATITGSGFDTTPANNTVMIGGVQATVTSATATQLDVTVPSACRPAGATGVTVQVGQITSATRSANYTPTAFLNLGVGEQAVIQDPSQFCLQFQQQAASETYLIGVQSTAEVVTSLTPVTLTSMIPGPVPAPPPAPTWKSGWANLSLGSLLQGREARRLARHRARELQIREFDRTNFDRLRSQWSGPQRVSAPRAAAIDSTVAVGDTLPVRIVDDPSATCNQYEEITTVVRANGVRGIWLEDVANPSGGYTAADFQAFSDQFDNLIYAISSAEFGDPTDADTNARVVMVITKAVNQRGSLGYTTSCDFGARTPGNQGSNEGEFFYGEAPDPNGDYGDEVSVEDALSVAGTIWTHELVHVVQIGQRFAAGGSFPSIWIAEGQATLGEEIVGHADEGRTTGQNYGLEVAINLDDTVSTDWYTILWVDLALYFGWDPISNPNDPDGRTANAPHECSFLDLPPNNPGPCLGGRDAYGTSWTLLRWMSDVYGPTYSGPSGTGEAGFHQDIINNTKSGFDLLSSLVNVPVDILLARWAATLYVDDRLGGANPDLEMTSWDLFNIFYGTATVGGQLIGLRESLRLEPDQGAFGNFSRSVNVRGGSTHYTLVSGVRNSAAAIRARNASDQTLPSHMRMWVVRMQ